MNEFTRWLSVNDASLLLGGLLTVGIPFATSLIKNSQWPDIAKFSLAVFLSAIGGFLTAYVQNQLVGTASIIQTIGVIFLASQAFYMVAFKQFGLERVLSPKSAMIQLAQDEVKNQLSEVSTEQAKDILDVNTPPAIDVTATVVNAKTDVM